MTRSVLILIVAGCLCAPATTLAQDSAPADAPSTAPASKPAEKPSDEKAAEAKPAPVPGATLKVGSMTVDGFTVSDLSCKLDGGGFLASATVVGGLAAQKGKIQKCGKSGDKVHVTWALKGGKAADVKVVGGSKKVQKCVAKAMKKVKVAIPGKCAAYFHLGK